MVGVERAKLLIGDLKQPFIRRARKNVAAARTHHGRDEFGGQFHAGPHAPAIKHVQPAAVSAD